MRRWLTFLHIAASVALLGASASQLLLALVAATSADGRLAHSAYELMSLQGMAFGIPLSWAALLSGIALGLSTKWGVLRYRWTTAKLALNALVVVNGAAGFGPAIDARLRGEGSAWGLVAIAAASVALLLTAVSLSVFKPGGLRRAIARAPQPSRR